MQTCKASNKYPIRVAIWGGFYSSDGIYFCKRYVGNTFLVRSWVFDNLSSSAKRSIKTLVALVWPISHLLTSHLQSRALRLAKWTNWSTTLSLNASVCRSTHQRKHHTKYRSKLKVHIIMLLGDPSVFCGRNWNHTGKFVLAETAICNTTQHFNCVIKHSKRFPRSAGECLENCTSVAFRPLMSMSLIRDAKRIVNSTDSSSTIRKRFEMAIEKRSRHQEDLVKKMDDKIEALQAVRSVLCFATAL